MKRIGMLDEHNTFLLGIDADCGAANFIQAQRSWQPLLPFGYFAEKCHVSIGEFLLLPRCRNFQMLSHPLPPLLPTRSPPHQRSLHIPPPSTIVKQICGGGGGEWRGK